MAGGFGTRIRSIADDIPKPMIKIAGKPVLQHEIECLREQGFTELILTVSHLKEVIKDYFGDGSAFGVNIEYFEENVPLGSAGALFRLRSKLNEDFLLLNADSVFDIDFGRLIGYHREKGGIATLFTHPNSHPYDSGLLITDEKGCVLEWLTKEEERPVWYKNRVNAGLHVLSPKVIDMALTRNGMSFSEASAFSDDGKPVKKWDLDRDLLKPLSGSGTMFAYDSPEYVKDMGTPERYEAVCRDFLSGTVKARNLRNRQKAVFLDRDGCVNRLVDFCNHIDKFELLPWAAENIRRINESGYLAVIVTNQPVVARGELSFSELREIFDKMETLLGKEGAYLDAIYFCPHHPHRGFAGERPELKIECECRKPKPGMLLDAARDYNIDLSESVMIGDSECDIKAGMAAGCKKNILVASNEPWDIREYL